MRYFVLFFLIAAMSACAQKKKNYTSPTQYDLNNPVIYKMPADLEEISGIAFYKGNDSVIYTEQDEKGNVYWSKPGDKQAGHFAFGKSGDYEDIALTDNLAILLRSDGVLYSFPFDGKTMSANNVKEWKGLLSSGEYEAMYADDANKKLYVLCKNCDDDKKNKVSGYIFDLKENNIISSSGNFSVDTKQIKDVDNKFKEPFRPSALTRNTMTDEWYILSSINKVLVVADKNWKVKNVYALNPKLFVQPEGIAFDKEGNLYISNEGAHIQSGTVFKFPYR